MCGIDSFRNDSSSSGDSTFSANFLLGATILPCASFFMLHVYAPRCYFVVYASAHYSVVDTKSPVSDAESAVIIMTSDEDDPPVAAKQLGEQQAGFEQLGCVGCSAFSGEVLRMPHV